MTYVTRVDAEGVPRRAQRWRRTSAEEFEVLLFDGRCVLFDLWTVRDESCRGYRMWDAVKDQMAIDYYVDKYWALIE